MVIGYLLWNLAAFLLVLLDKRRARRGEWRVKERTFFLWALCFGAIGIWAGMYTFRHKTRHLTFVIGIPLLVLLNIACYYLASERIGMLASVAYNICANKLGAPPVCQNSTLSVGLMIPFLM